MKISILLFVGATLFGLCLGSYSPSSYQYEMRKNLDDFSGITKHLFKDEYRKFRKTSMSTVSEVLQTLFDVLKPPIEVRRQEIEDIALPQQSTLCALCRAAVGVVIDYRRDGMEVQDLKTVLLDLCIRFQLFPEQVCRGAIDKNAPIFTHIIDNRQNLTEDVICGLVMQGSNCVISNFEQMEWSINIDPTPNPITGHKQDPLVRSDDDVQIVHISDIHYDPHFTIGSNANCQEPVCCRTGVPAVPGDATQRWGDYRSCDSPWDSVPDINEQVNRQHPNIDYIYYTGDLVDHGVWETTFEGNIHIITRVFDQFAKDFPGIPVFPVLGNHEAQPTNQFPPTDISDPQFSNQWLYDLVAEQWAKWLKDDGADVTLREHGFYTVLVRPGFRVVGLNNQDCYNFNFWLIYEPSLGIRQLQWLHDVLLQAEANNEKVHILAHIPSGSGGCFTVWAREYRRIIDRFWNTVTGVFNGHTHRDEFNVFYSRSQPSFAINVGFNGGSATTFSNVNHNYRVYYVDNQNFQVIDYDSYIFNLTEANLTPDQNPRWFKNYSFREEYGVSDLSPGNLHALTDNMATNPELLATYWRNLVKSGDAALANGCDEACLANALCNTVRTEWRDDARCAQLVNTFTATLINGRNKH